MSEDCFVGRTERVGDHQRVVPVIMVCRVFKSQAAFQVILVLLHLGVDVRGLDFAPFMEPLKRRMRETSHSELDASVVPPFRLLQLYDLRGN